MSSLASNPPHSNGAVDPKKERLAQLQAQIQARFGTPTINNQLNAFNNLIQEKKPSKPAPLILDSEGRTVDAEGNEVKLIKRVPTLKANIRVQKKDEIIKPVTKGIDTRLNNDEASSSFFDQRLQLKMPVRARKGLVFHEKGKFEAMAETIRKKAKLELLQKGISEHSKKYGISQQARLTMLNSIEPKKEEKLDEHPDIEWWDACILKKETYEWYLENKDQAPEDKFENITHLIEHPMQMRPPTEPLKPILLPAFLTTKERKKLRRQNRREALKEKQERVRLGLDPPPEPKVKMSNMMRVLGSTAVQDPTKVEGFVREQVARRKREHEESNAARKLTDEQRKEKRIRRIKEDTTLGVHVSVYRVLNLSNPTKKFKIETNAKQLMMTGIAVLYKNINIVVVEGGPKQQKKYRRLMMNRINWSEDAVPKEFCENASDEVENKCVLVWQGTVKERSFGEFKIKVSPNESFARELFKNHGVSNYFDLAFSVSILDNDD